MSFETKTFCFSFSHQTLVKSHATCWILRQKSAQPTQHRSSIFIKRVSAFGTNLIDKSVFYLIFRLLYRAKVAETRLWITRKFLSIKIKRHTSVVLVIIFENATKKVNNCQNDKKGILIANSFFKCVLKNTDQKDICASIVFKDESKLKTWRNFFFVFLFKNQKHAFPGIQNSSF